MKVLVDTCVWSQALRRKNPDSKISGKLTDLINDSRATLIGPIKQEILSGISNKNHFEKLKAILCSFEMIQLENTHFEVAAELCNICRANGIQGSTIDFLICAVAHSEKMFIFTVDKDFENYARFLPIQIMK